MTFATATKVTAKSNTVQIIAVWAAVQATLATVPAWSDSPTLKTWATAAILAAAGVKKFLEAIAVLRGEQLARKLRHATRKKRGNSCRI